MIQTPEQLDETIQQARKSHKPSDYLLSELMGIPKSKIPAADLSRVKMQIFDRISLPASMKSEKVSKGAGFMALLPRILRITGGIVGAFTILLSLTIGASVAALEAVPGQPIYPLKKIVENVRLQLARSDEQRATLQIKFANNRIDELEAVLKKQREGKISDAEAQKVVADTTKDIEKTSQNVNQSSDENKVSLLTKIVDLSNKQSAVIQAAQISTDGDVKIELDKALASSKVTKEQAIQNIEKAGLVVEEQPLTLGDPDDVNSNEVTTEGKLTALTTTTVNLGSVQFLLTKDTEYVNIKSGELVVGSSIKITGEVVEKKTYARKIELISKPDPTPTPTTTPTTTPKPSVTPTPVDQSGGTNPTGTVPTIPAD